MEPIQPVMPNSEPKPTAGEPFVVPAETLPGESPPKPPVTPATPVAPASGVPPIPAAPPVNAATGTPAAAQSPAIADDVDVIEKDWVDAAEEVVKNTRDDPYRQEEAVESLQVDYLKKRYGKDVKRAEEG